jgi:hypothetical protein
VIAGVLTSQSRAAGSAPAYVQQVSAHSPQVTSLALTPGAPIATGDRRPSAENSGPGEVRPATVDCSMMRARISVRMTKI